MHLRKHIKVLQASRSYVISKRMEPGPFVFLRGMPFEGIYLRDEGRMADSVVQTRGKTSRFNVHVIKAENTPSPIIILV
ncbi:hypothetical protein FRX31_026502 [Thalictrum thalictroides]|uniref:Uncharacterized protein n=1 Tax=Thalictrum thalictroides TaxID=46969 RepID=A0A7J6VGJ9_THATH|nr:hypothetical protein FRX31_026502 [Thalictrum thalictroides]